MTHLDTASLAGPEPRGHELSIVIPTYCERGNVAALAERLAAALGGLKWQAIFVDDASPDGTAEAVKALALQDPRISCLRRVGRRGLAGAVMEGALASAAPFVLVMDADGQHDERLISAMVMRMRGGRADLVVASRYLDAGDASEGLSKTRLHGSRMANRLVSRACGVSLSDPMSGFFVARREVFDTAAARIAPDGFKVLFDLIVCSPPSLRVEEVPLHFRTRREGRSKFDRRIVLDYLSLVCARASRNLVSPRALIFTLVGASGVAVHMAVLRLLIGCGFGAADLVAALTAMSSNYLLNNAITYRDRRRRNWALLRGYFHFFALCSFGLLVNLAVATLLAEHLRAWGLPGLLGALAGAAWNYSTTALMLW